jgi:hypothetical protein
MKFFDRDDSTRVTLTFPPHPAITKKGQGPTSITGRGACNCASTKTVFQQLRLLCPTVLACLGRHPSIGQTGNHADAEAVRRFRRRSEMMSALISAGEGGMPRPTRSVAGVQVENAKLQPPGITEHRD